MECFNPLSSSQKPRLNTIAYRLVVFNVCSTFLMTKPALPIWIKNKFFILLKLDLLALSQLPRIHQKSFWIHHKFEIWFDLQKQIFSIRNHTMIFLSLCCIYLKLWDDIPSVSCVVKMHINNFQTWNTIWKTKNW